jgi:hypothetical protein
MTTHTINRKSPNTAIIEATRANKAIAEARFGGKLTAKDARTLASALESELGEYIGRGGWSSAIVEADKAREWLAAEIPPGRDIEPVLALAAKMGLRFAIYKIDAVGRKTVDHLDERNRDGRTKWECNADWEPTIGLYTLRVLAVEGNLQRAIAGMRLAVDAPDQPITLV